MSIQLVNKIHFRNWRGDLFGGVTAAIVALPLALAFGVASGAGAIAGLYGAIFVGFFAALFGGTPAQVSGPTGPMTVVATTVIASLIANYKDNLETALALAFTVVMLGGLFQILLGVMKLGQYITLMPYTVISGFMSGIGVIIILLQLPPLLGYASTGAVLDTLKQLPSYISQPNPVAMGLGILTLFLVFVAPPKLNRVFPSPLMALIVCTILSVLFFKNADISRIGAIPSELPKLRMPTFGLRELADMLRYGLTLGFLGAIDSLLTSLVADSITQTQHDSDKELIGQGIGNVLAGLFGGLSGAGATMRTVVNVKAGGKTPLSGMIHAVVLLMVVLVAGPLTAVIPHAVLAGLLLKVGIDIIDWNFIKRAHHLSFTGTGLMYLVLFLTVFIDLITAVVVGAFIANILTIKRLTELQSDRIQAITDPAYAHNLNPEERELLAQAEGKILLFQLGGPLSFGAAKVISQRMSIVQDYQALVLDLSEVPEIGVTAALAIETSVLDALKRDRQVWIVTSSVQVKRRLDKLQLQKFSEVYFTGDRLQALQSIHYPNSQAG
ncbi:SulP family inorganic anion transporter [Tumidithrix helvetica PCC 7403]|uniref:SulP family inorganic anion transporter n=1 Tax=Tumidithrix helvetica TaxID=3457545 RepID=UPI003CBF3401